VWSAGSSERAIGTGGDRKISRLIVAAIAHQVFDEIASERVDGKV
jgi:hypothetical protein